MIRLILLSALVTVAYGTGPFLGALTPKLDGRIVGGEDTTIEEHPYQVSFQIYNQHFCGGAWIGSNIVVTAAHCTDGTEIYRPFMTIRFGSTKHTSGGQIIRVASIHAHPKYAATKSNDYDACVVVLKQAPTSNTGVKAIGLQDRGAEVSTGTLGRVTGWGSLSSGGSSPETLQAIDVPKVDQSKCQDDFPRETISDRMHCFGFDQGGKDSCQGDSGGPLVVDGKLTGIVSWGYGCALAYLPGVYAKVANQEIHDHITEISGQYAL